LGEVVGPSISRQDACRPLLLRTLFSLQVTAKAV
jgi:hypothetical protein